MSSKGTSGSRVRSAVAGGALAALIAAGGSAALAAPAGAAPRTRELANSSSGVDAAAVAAKVDPAIVDVNTTLQGGAAAGTGMVLTSSGEVLTNNHVIDGATSVTATDSTGRKYSAKVVGYDAADDVAVLQLQGASKLPTVSVASTAPAVGDPVVALGNALGRGGTPATAEGSVTAVDQTITAADDNGANPETLHNMIQIDANIQPGDSGGPLVNANGQVVGMDSAGSSSQASIQASRAAVDPSSGNGGGFGFNGGGSGLAPDPGSDPSLGGGAGFGDGSGGSLGGGSLGGGSRFGGGSLGGGSGFGGGSLGGGSGFGGGSNSGGGSTGGSGSTVGFAIPIQNALSVAHQIDSGSTGGNVTVGSRAILGVEVQSSSVPNGSTDSGGVGSQSGSGVQISGVQSGSPAASAGLTGGDTIVALDGHRVGSAADISSALSKHHPGDKVQVTWTDTNGQTQHASVALVSGPPA